MKSHLRCGLRVSIVLVAIFSWSSLGFAADEVVAGNLTVEGGVDIEGDALSLGTRSDSSVTPGLTLLYADAAAPSIYFNTSRGAANWFWQGENGKAQMALDASNGLKIYDQSVVPVAKVVLNPLGTSLFSGPVNFISSGLLDSGNQSDRAYQVAFVGPNKVIGSATNSGQIGIFSNDNFSVNSGGSLVFGSTFNAAGHMAINAGIRSGRDNSINGTYGGYLSFYTRAHGNNALERVRFTSAGNVGIGTSAPSERLEIVGNLKVTGVISSGSFSPAGAINVASGQGIAFENGYNPAYITSPGSDRLRFGVTSGMSFEARAGGLMFPVGNRIMDQNGSILLGFGYTDTAVNYILIDNAIGGMGPTIRTAGADVDVNLNLVPKGSGNVGVGTENPVAKLDVAGDAQVRGKLRIPPSGDLSMGDFTAGSNPAE